jgi:hypothetical protein
MVGENANKLDNTFVTSFQTRFTILYRKVLYGILFVQNMSKNVNLGNGKNYILQLMSSIDWEYNNRLSFHRQFVIWK